MRYYRSIYDLPLHQDTRSGRWAIKRVPGGWIYTNLDRRGTIFVPYSEEFLEEEKELGFEYKKDIESRF